MPEPNEKQTPIPVKRDLCRITIAFPVSSDEEAIAYKKKVVEPLADIADARIEFSLMTMPKR